MCLCVCVWTFSVGLEFVLTEGEPSFFSLLRLLVAVVSRQRRFMTFVLLLKCFALKESSHE